MYQFLKNNINFWFFIIWIVAADVSVMTMGNRFTGERILFLGKKYETKLSCIYSYIHDDIFFFLVASVVIGGLLFIKEKWQIKFMMIATSLIAYYLLHMWIALSISC